jgi:DNA-binding MarR family transcriptional regulator/GNAT superfamily N-acetyltransferase
MDDGLKGLGELGMGSRLKRMSEYMMRETQVVYDHFNIDFDPYLFPTFKIIKNKKGVTNSEIRKSLKTSQPATTQTLNKLEKRGLIAIAEDPKDKRRKIVYLSEKGEQLVTQISPIWEGIEQVIIDYTTMNSHSLIDHMNQLEQKFNRMDFSTAIITHLTMNTAISPLQIRNYEAAYAPAFYELNIEWLRSFFYVEPYDEEVLSNPQKYILDQGGSIFFAQLEGTIVGTVALMPRGEEMELSKMAVSPKHRGHKIGQQLMQHCIDFARDQGLEKLILYSNRTLENAIYIYKKYGFVEIPVEANSPYQRSDIKMELAL